MRVDLLTREYPPHVYGGAGVHVTELAKVLRSRVDELRIHAFDGPREDAGEVIGYSDLPELAHDNPALRTLGVDIAIAADTLTYLVCKFRRAPIIFDERHSPRRDGSFIGAAAPVEG